MFLAYVANVSDNLHNFSAIALMIIGFSAIWGWLPLFDSNKNVFQTYILPNIRKILLVVGILLAIFLFTPSSWRHSMDMQYIEENSQLRQEINDITRQLNACEMKRGKYANYDD